MSTGRSSTASEMDIEPRNKAFEKRRLCGVLSLLLCGTSAAAGPVSGVVQTTVRAGTRAAQAVVFAEPLDRPATPKGVKASLTQKDKSFSPDVLGVPVGSTIDFPNADPIFHNVFSLSPPAPFDLGLYRAGASRTRVFSAPATYRVFCNIHPQMTALRRCPDAVRDRHWQGRQLFARAAAWHLSTDGNIRTSGPDRQGDFGASLRTPR